MKVLPVCVFLIGTPLLVTLQAVDILGVDFGRNDPGLANEVTTTGTSPLEPGFVGFFLGNAFGTGIASLTYSGLSTTFTTGSVTVEVQGDLSNAAGSMGGRDRTAPTDNGAFTFGDLLRDGLARTKLTSTAGDFTLRLSGLRPNTTFSIRIWASSSANDVNTNYTWFDTTVGSNSLGTILNGPNNPLTATSNTDYSVFGTVVSSSAGQLLFGVTSSNASPTAGYIDGFQLSSDIPEPNALALLSLATLGILARRRGRTDGRQSID